MKKSTKVLIVAMIAILSIFSMVGCSNDKNEEVKTYIAATEPTYPPFDSVDDDGNIIGFDMDLLNAIAEDQGFKVEYKSFEFDAIVPAVQSGSADIAAAAVNITPDREEKVAFSDKYFDSGKVILVKSDNDKINGIDDLKPTMKVAAQIGTTESDYVQDLAKKNKIGDAVILNQTTQCILQLQNGDVDAVIMDAPVSMYYQNKFADEIKQLDALIDPSPMAFAVAKENEELLEKLNKGLANVKESGKYDELVKKWFESSEI